MSRLRRINTGQNFYRNEQADFRLKIAQIDFILEHSDYLRKRKNGNELVEKMKSMKRYYASNKFLSPGQINEIDRVYELTIEEWGKVHDKGSEDIKAARNQKNKWGVNLKV